MQTTSLITMRSYIVFKIGALTIVEGCRKTLSRKDVIPVRYMHNVTYVQHGTPEIVCSQISKEQGAR